jgi:hypothetical protein
MNGLGAPVAAPAPAGTANRTLTASIENSNVVDVRARSRRALIRSITRRTSSSDGGSTRVMVPSTVTGKSTRRLIRPRIPKVGIVTQMSAIGTDLPFRWRRSAGPVSELSCRSHRHRRRTYRLQLTHCRLLPSPVRECLFRQAGTNHNPNPLEASTEKGSLRTHPARSQFGPEPVVPMSMEGCHHNSPVALTVASWCDAKHRSTGKYPISLVRAGCGPRTWGSP